MVTGGEVTAHVDNTEFIGLSGLVLCYAQGTGRCVVHMHADGNEDSVLDKNLHLFV